MLLSIYLVAGLVIPSPGMIPQHHQPVWVIVSTLVLQVIAVTINIWAIGRVLAGSREPVVAPQPDLVLPGSPAAP
jgi:hypothetical protein